VGSADGVSWKLLLCSMTVHNVSDMAGYRVGLVPQLREGMVGVKVWG